MADKNQKKQKHNALTNTQSFLFLSIDHIKDYFYFCKRIRRELIKELIKLRERIVE